MSSCMQATDATATVLHRRVLKLMGNRFELSIAAADEGWAAACLEEAITEIRRIEALLTTFHADSQTQLINAHAGIRPVAVSREVFGLVQRSLKISRLTQGAFDISYGSLDKSLWNFDTHMSSLPDPATAKQLVRLINYRNVLLDAQAGTIFLKEKGMRIGFGGLGTGYASETPRRLLRGRGIQAGVVNAAGDLATWGTQPDGTPWTIGIADPNNRHHPFSQLSIGNMAVATS